MTQTSAEIWTIIALLGAGTLLIRFSFLGLIGDRALPDWVLRLLRYAPVAIIPGLVAPLVLWPDATGGSPEPARMLAAVVTLVVGARTKNVIFAILAGALTLFAGLQIF